MCCKLVLTSTLQLTQPRRNVEFPHYKIAGYQRYRKPGSNPTFLNGWLVKSCSSQTDEIQLYTPIEWDLVDRAANPSALSSQNILYRAIADHSEKRDYETMRCDNQMTEWGVALYHTGDRAHKWVCLRTHHPWSFTWKFGLQHALERLPVTLVCDQYGDMHHLSGLCLFFFAPLMRMHL
jgi:hypothetical protein